MTMRDKIATIIVENRAVQNWENPTPSDYELADAIIAALPELAPEWLPIETAPRDDTRFLAWCPPSPKFPDGRIMIWSGRILFGATGYPTPDHLQYPATMWQPLVPPVMPVDAQ